MIVVALVLALVIVLATLIFAVVNGTPVTINLIFSQIPTQLSLAIIIPFFAGVVVGLLMMTPGAIRNQLKIAGHKKKIANLEKASASQQAQVAPVNSDAPAKDE